MELNREQIIKALELCVEWHSTDDCYKCPYYVPEGICECAEDDFLLKQALSIIKELTEENERLQKALNTDISIVRVSRGSGKTAHLQEVGRIKVDAIRADTVRKMQERLKTEAYPFPCAIGVEYAVPYCKIDQIAKEMLEGAGNESDTGSP